MFRPSFSVIFLSCVALGPLAGAGNFALTIDNIMRGPGLVGTEPAQVRWSADSSKIYVQWKKATDPVAAPLDSYEVNRDGSGLHKLSDDEVRLTTPANADVSEDRAWSVFSQDGDI